MSQLKTDQLETEELRAIFAEYPIYLRWGQVVELHERLGLGSKWLVKQAIKAKRIKRVHVYGTRAHYTRASVADLCDTEL